MKAPVHARNFLMTTSLRSASLAVLVAAAVLPCLPAATRYVWLSSPGPSGGFTTWATAATNIQDAIDVSSSNDVIVVTNGVYSSGGRAGIDGLTNRVTLDVAVTVRSVNGAAVTQIKGLGPIGAGAVRCAFVGAGAVLSGFTLTNGFTRAFGAIEGNGGGAYCEPGGVLSNCVVCVSGAGENGGGVYRGTLYGCTLFGNDAGDAGGGSYGANLNGCTVTVNNATGSGGGSAFGVLSNSVILGNTAGDSGGGASACAAIYSCILTGNVASFDGGGAESCALYGSRVANNSAGGLGGGLYLGSAHGSIIVSNYAAFHGGGASYATLGQCTVTLNRAVSEGGGMHWCDASNSLVVGNAAGDMGGGAKQGTLLNCTLVGNTATNASESGTGGGADWSTLVNCIAWYNTADDGTNWFGNSDGVDYCSTTPMPAGDGNITAEPLFVDLPAGDYRIAGNSPCIDSGSNQAWMATATDLGGNARLFNGVVDMGAFEAMPLHYVATNGAHVWPFVTWGGAATNIQDAVDASLRGDTILVSNGVYATGGRQVTVGITNRLAINRPVTVRSVNGPTVTTIKGSGPIGNSAVRCVYVGTNAVLAGFTLTNGYTRSTGGAVREQSGGGAWCDVGAIVSNCVIVGNSAYSYGGGSYSGTLYNCRITGNSATAGGSGSFGGGVFSGWLENCTLAGNSSVYAGGGVFGGTLYNCIAYYNSASLGANWSNSVLNYSCTTPSAGGTGNITNAPMFANTNAANYRLQTGSPCINTGTNLAWMVDAADLDGVPRIVGGRADMGAYESTNGFTAAGVSWAWLLDHGMATDGSEDYDDPDLDAMDNLKEYVADTDPLSLLSFLRITNIQATAQNMNVAWVGGVQATQYLERSYSLLPTGAVWKTLLTNMPPTPSSTNFVDIGATNASAFYRIRAVRGN